MKLGGVLSRVTASLFVAAILALGAGIASADINGRTGKAQSTNGCNCHGNTRTAGVTVTISGPQSVLLNSAHPYTVTVTGGAATTKGGFNLKVSGGTLTAGANNQVTATEVTHINENSRSWTFTWKAPATIGTQNFWAIALAADGTGDESGDGWNWYGGVVNTAFPITVTNATGVGDEAALTFLAPPTPNPCTSSASIAFSLASASPVRLELLDAAGRLVRTLAQGTMPAGRQSIQWNGRSNGGARTPAGVYFVRMTTPQRNLVTRVTVLD